MMRWIARAVVAVVLVGLTVSPAPATIAEQRARLPPPAECDDPVAGTWRALVYYPTHLQWYEFTLEIQRVPGNDEALTGTILSHYWDGPEDNAEPPNPCYGKRFKIRMPAEGTYEDGTIKFGGTSYELEQEVCGHFSLYYVDTFTGEVDRALNEFNSYNDWVDEGTAYHLATVFRRIKCFEGDEPAGPREDGSGAKPPAFYPRSKRTSGGC
jgi:hypothetical protein